MIMYMSEAMLMSFFRCH